MYLKILLTFLTAFSLSASAQTFTGRVAEESVNVTADSTATVLGWFNMLESKGLVLSYNSSDINLYEKIKMPGQRMGIDDFLGRVLYRYVYELQNTEGNKILIRIKGVKTFVLLGHVSDADTDENLGDCSIMLINQQNEIFSTATDINGMFRISVPIGKYKLKTTYIGFDRYSKPITLNRNLYAEIKMKQTSIPMKEVVVKTSPLSDIINYKGSYDILSVNSSDPFSQINSLPGVSGTSVTGNFNVNGGQSDENLILLDGIPVYHSQHNNSLLSQFNGDAVQKVSFYDSFIPARYEGRLSSVTDVKIKEGGMKRHSQNINIELPSASLTLDGPIIKDKFTYMISARHSWLDFMENIFSGNPDLNRSFMDITSKLMFRANEYTYFRALLYRSTDSFNDTIDSYKNQEVLEWISGMYSVSLDTRIAGKIYNNSMLAYSEYKNKIFAPLIDIPSPFYINEGMSKYVMKSDFITSLDRYTDLSWGIKLLHERFNLLASKDTVENNKHDVSQISSYLNTKIKISRRLNLSAAVSFVSYLPKGNPSFFSIQPRFTMRYLCDDKNVISLDFSRMEQFYHNICLGEIPIPTDLRMPSIEGFAPSSSLHGEVGWKHNEKNSMFTISTFYKRRFNILGVRYTIESEKDGWESFIMDGNASSYGIKIYTTGKFPHWMYDLSYTYSRSLEWFKDYDENRIHATLYDVPHILRCALSYRIGDKSFVTIGGYVRSGVMENVFGYGGVENEFITGRERRKANYRIDMNFSSNKVFVNKNLELSYKLGLYNIIGRPRDNEIIDLYTVNTDRHCLPYFALKLKF